MGTTANPCLTTSTQRQVVNVCYQPRLVMMALGRWESQRAESKLVDRQLFAGSVYGFPGGCACCVTSDLPEKGCQSHLTDSAAV